MIDKIDVIEKPKRDLKDKLRDLLTDNIVTVIFAILCIIGFQASGLTFSFYLNDIITRIARNAFLILALIIPVLAGMGLNFAIVLGAMAGQASIIAVAHWGITGWQGILLCAVVATPLAIIFGYLTGQLLNKTKGQEMITSLILGFFANGIYQMVFLILVGSVIPMKNEELILSTGVGVRTTIDLTGKLKYGLDDILKLSFPMFVLLCSIGLAIYAAYNYFSKKSLKANNKKHTIYGVTSLILIAFSIITMNAKSFGNASGSLRKIILELTMINNVKVPIATGFLIALLCLFTVFISKTKLGQDFKSVGQDMHIATVSGINSNRIRIIAIVISTVLAAWGQIIFLQNLGTFSTYGSHEQAGMFSIAALLIGGASVTKATIGQALLGAVLFHTLFIVSPLAGRNMFGDPQLGEFFRSFVAYGVIGISLGMHAWKQQMQAKNKLKL